MLLETWDGGGANGGQKSMDHCKLCGTTASAPTHTTAEDVGESEPANWVWSAQNLPDIHRRKYGASWSPSKPARPPRGLPSGR
jgi:hypothetical protein